MVQVKSTIKIDSEIWKRARIEAIKRDMFISEALEQALIDWMKK